MAHTSVEVSMRASFAGNAKRKIEKVSVPTPCTLVLFTVLSLGWRHIDSDPFTEFARRPKKVAGSLAVLGGPTHTRTAGLTRRFGHTYANVNTSQSMTVATSTSAPPSGLAVV